MIKYRPEPNLNLVNGAFVMLDALGYKGIWKKHSRESVLSIIKNLRKVVQSQRVNNQEEYEQFLEDLMPPTDWVMTEMFNFSDSIFIGVWHHYEANSPRWSRNYEEFDDQKYLIRKAILICSHIIREALVNEKIHFKFRGVITYGDFYMNQEEGFLLGPAVDEAAMLERSANGAFVWLAKSALDYFSSWDNKLVTTYPVPMKEEKIFETTVINPFAEGSSGNFELSNNDAVLLARLLSNSSSASPDVIRKIENIHEFYRLTSPNLYEKAKQLLNK